MWVETLRPHLGGVSLWRYTLKFLVVLCAALLWTISFSSHAHAADATWQSGSVLYQDKTYQGPTKADKAAAERLGIPENSQYYEYIDTSSDPKKSKIIYFSPGDDVKDAASAQYAEYTYDDKGTEEKYTKVAGSNKGISIDKQSSVDGGGGAKEETSCVVGGIGYVICPIMSFLADAMDKMYDLLKRFLEVKPLSTDHESGLYKAWAIMLSFANALFIAGFLVIIYSYITGQGVKQYDLRNIIPRLIVAAILINVSYYICAIAVDASNVFGSNLQDIFNGLRKQVVANDVTDTSVWSWNIVTTFILSGGTIGALAGGAFALGTYGFAALHLLTPMLIGAAFAILVVVIVLAARQAIITVLIVVAPLAFAAFILPSTQKYFDKWKDLFMTMLLMYPMFALLFGGSQLAATLIAQNASSIVVILLAMFVQVAPLVITPFLIKFSGGLLGKLAGMVNNPAKGPLDAAKNWSRNKADMAKDRRINEGARGAALARRMADTKRHEENLKKRYDTMAQARYNKSARGRQSMIEQSLANDQLARADKLNEAAYEELKRTDPKVRMQAVQLKIADMELNVNKAKMDTYLHELESKKGAQHYAAGGAQVEKMLGAAARSGDAVARSSLASSMHKLAEENMAMSSRKGMAEAVHRSEYADQVLKNRALAEMAGGIKGETGANLALANATQTIRKDFGEGVNAQLELLKHFGGTLDNKALKGLALGGTATGYDSQGRQYTFDTRGSNVGGELHEAAVTKFLQESNYEGAREIIKAAADGVDANGKDLWAGLHGTIKDQIIKVHMGKAPFLSGQSLDVIDQGLASSAGGYNQMIVNYIGKGKFSGEKLAVATDALALEDMLKVVYAHKTNNMASLGPGVESVPDGFGDNVDALIESVRSALADPLISSQISQTNREKLLAIKHMGSPRRL